MTAEPQPLIVRPERPFPTRIVLAVALLAIVAGVAWFVRHNFFRREPLRIADDVENFKYGSIGNVPSSGIPYYIWMVLPRVFPEYLPGNGGYASLGMVWEPGHETPVGFTKMTIGFPRIAHNCAACHSGSFRKQGQLIPTVIPGAPAHQFNPQGYLRFLSNCARDDRFNADVILPQIEYFARISPVDKLLYRYLIIPQTRKELLRQARINEWQEGRPDWGCGRIDPFNPVKFGVLGLDPGQDTDGTSRYDTVGNSDMEPLFGLKKREGQPFHWDGMTTSLEEVVISGAIGDGTAKKDVNYDEQKRIERTIANFVAPKFPYEDDPDSPYRRDEEAIRRGAAAYEKAGCARCHSPGGELTNKVVPIEEVGTDPERHKLWSNEAAARYNAYADDYPWDFSGFVGTNGPGGGYVSHELEGVWIRAPFLHNGSVPTLRDLFEPVEKRPRSFYRGYDVYDPVKAGWVSDVPESPDNDGRPFTRFDVYDASGKPIQGNGNGGHLWGVELNDDEKADLVEYLKSL
jgi:hypothetical protein